MADSYFSFLVTGGSGISHFSHALPTKFTEIAHVFEQVANHEKELSDSAENMFFPPLARHSDFFHSVGAEARRSGGLFPSSATPREHIDR